MQRYDNMSYGMVEESTGLYVFFDEVEKLQEQYENELRDKEALIVELKSDINEIVERHTLGK